MSITETFLDSTSGYNIFWKDHERHGGGMLVMVYNSITVVHHHELENSCEILWLDLHVQRGVIDFVSYYHPPTSSHHHELENSCEILWLDLHVQRGVIDFVSYYHPPTSSMDS